MRTQAKTTTVQKIWASNSSGLDCGRVLVVDDNQDSAQLRRGARAEGYDARIALDAASALQVAAEMRPDIAILDIGLPVRTGTIWRPTCEPFQTSAMSISLRSPAMARKRTAGEASRRAFASIW